MESAFFYLSAGVDSCGVITLFNKIIITVRGTERYHMENYFLNRQYKQENADVFIIRGIQVKFEPQRKIYLRALPITEVELCFSGDKETILNESEKFKLAFMTAGG